MLVLEPKGAKSKIVRMVPPERDYKWYKLVGAECRAGSDIPRVTSGTCSSRLHSGSIAYFDLYHPSFILLTNLTHGESVIVLCQPPSARPLTDADDSAQDGPSRLSIYPSPPTHLLTSVPTPVLLCLSSKALASKLQDKVRAR